MSRTAIPLYVADQLITVAHANTYWRDNEAAAWPYDSTGGLAYATGAADLAELEITDAGLMVSVHDDVDKPEWSGWEQASIYGYYEDTLATVTTTTLTLNVALYDKTPPGFIADPTLDRITIPAGWDGWYLITFHILWDSDNTGERRGHAWLNGVDILRNVRIAYRAIPNGRTTCCGAGLVYLVATDFIQLRAWQNSGGNLDVQQATLELSLVLGG